MTLETRYIEGDWREKCLKAMALDGFTVVAPVRDGDLTRFAVCTSDSAEILSLRGNTNFPLKEVFFPMTECVLNYKTPRGEEPNFSTPEGEDAKIAVLGGRPCDAAALKVLDIVFNWDYKDSFYNRRRDQSLIITVACAEKQDHCFCTTLGYGPDTEDGSDLLILEAKDIRGALVRICSEKGAAFAAAHGEMFAEAPSGISTPIAEVPVKFELDKIKPWLDVGFDDDFWEEVALACMGCGACSYLCPTCHCFDLVDEGNWQGGERRRNYDCCSFAMFTLHTSGHNPRPTQATRCRNRIMHKFRYFMERFEQNACVGCGRCLRACGAGQSLISILKRIASQAAKETQLEAQE